MNIVIFSKNRSCQLDLLLRSLKKHFKDQFSIINVLFTYTDNFFRRGYDKLINQYKNINFVLQKDFKKDVLSLINNYSDFLVFFVDDNVMIKDFDIKSEEMNMFIQNKHIVHSLNLRLGKNITYCYTENKEVIPLNIINGLIEFKGIQNNGDCCYKFSLDGEIFLKDDIVALIRKAFYNSANTLEGHLQQYNLNKSYKICYNQSIVTNLAINRVQLDNSNRCGNIGIEYLNQKYLDGYIIDLESIEKIIASACHQELQLQFIKIY